MKKRNLLLALLLLLSFALTACSSASYDSGFTQNASPAAAGDFAPMPEPMAPAEYPETDMGYDSPVSSESYPMANGGGNGSYYENTKVILTASLSLQATDFDGAVAALDALVAAQNGYYESSEYSYGGYYSTGTRWGFFTIRVPKEHYQAFLSAVGDVAHVVNRTTSTQDVGEAYYDAELHLATLKTKHERLLALLDQATEMEDIIVLESALSDVEFQIQQYSSTLTRYDGLIDFATINLDLQEVVRVTDNPTEADPLTERMGAAFTRGWNNFCDGMADFAVWAAYNFMGLIIFLIIVVAAVLVFLRVRRSRKEAEAVYRFRNEPKEDPKDKTE